MLTTFMANRLADLADIVPPLACTLALLAVLTKTLIYFVG